MSNIAPQQPGPESEDHGSTSPMMGHPHAPSIDFSKYTDLRTISNIAAQINLVSPIPPAPDLTRYITKINNQPVAGGSFGDVYKCRHVNGSTSEEVAVKALRYSVDEDKRKRYDKMVRRELGVWKRLSHKNIVPFLGIAYGFGMEGAISLVSLWMPNGTLHKFLETQDSKLNVAHRLQILLDIAEGLHYLHSFPIVHGDLNTNNVFLDANHTARLADFGYASFAGNIPEAFGYLQRSTTRPGALRWIAPEQINLEGSPIRTIKNDIYSFGCIALQGSSLITNAGHILIFLQVLSGKRPWSEVDEDACVVLRLHYGHMPGRPESQTMDDSHWNFIQSCWSPLHERPETDTVIHSIRRLLDNSLPYDGYMDGNDIIIAVMGQTGAGKSSFVNKAAGKTEVVIGHDLKSQTHRVQPVRCTHPDGRRNVILVDTPGFNDTRLSDLQILRITAEWLRQTYQSNIKLTGILYLHRISDPKMAGTPLRNLQIFKDLCGDDNLKNIVLVTTMWDEIGDQPVGPKREEELRSKYWKDMIRLGSDTHRFQGTRESAWEIIDRLVLNGSRQTRVPLEIQREMVDRHLPLHETAAAKTLLRFVSTEFKKVWTRVRNGVRGAIGARRPSEDQQRHVLSRTSTIESHTSGTWSVVSGNPTIGSSHSAPEITASPTDSLSSAWSASTSCSANGRQNTLSVTVTALRLVYQVADMSGIPMLRGAIEAVVQIAELIDRTSRVHHAIIQVTENAGWILQELVQFTATYKLTSEMEQMLASFIKKFNRLRDVVVKNSAGGKIVHLLHESDVQAIMMCADLIRKIYDMVKVKVAMDNREVMARVENQLKELCTDPPSRQCQCGTSVPHEESREPQSGEQHPETASQST